MTPTTGLVLTGGGARAAYQVGVLKAVMQIRRESNAPPGNPFPVITGTSAGAINAAALACGADQFDRAVTVIGYRSGNYLWHSCGTCGRNRPKTGYLNAAGQIQAIPTHVAVADHRCPVCDVPGVLIGIKIRNPVKGKSRTRRHCCRG